MIKNNSGVTMTSLAITVFVILILASVTITATDALARNTKSKAIITNMYLVRGKAESIYEEYQFSEEINLPGENVNVSTLSTYGVYSSGNTEDNTWYRWTKTTLQNNGLAPEMLSEGAEYIVNYETGEVIYTAGIKKEGNIVKYKLTDFINEEN